MPESVNLLELSAEQIKSLIKSGKIAVSVFGLGSVGLAIATVWLRAGARVIGVDIDDRKVKDLNTGVVRHSEQVVVETIKSSLRAGTFYATTSGGEAVRESNVLDIIVPVLYNSGGPDFTSLDDVVVTIGKNMVEGQAVVLESSVPPLTTEYRVRPVLEELSNLRSDIDFALIYSPERVLVGRAVEDIEVRYPKIVSGVGPRSLALAEKLFSIVAKAGVVKASSPRVAEFAKLAEGVYRDVNIALANELSKLSQALDVDLIEVIEIANTQPYSHLHKPGAGVGGHCIPVYPRFLSWLGQLHGVDLELVELARRINDSQPLQVVRLLLEEVGGIERRKVKVAVLGLAYRGNVPIPIGSPTYRIVKELVRLGYEVTVHDPLIEADPLLSSLGASLVKDLVEALKGSDVVIVATDHNHYKEVTPCKLVELSQNPGLIIIDARDVIDVSECCGARYLGIGRGRKCA